MSETDVEQRLAVPTKHEAGMEPLVTQVDILRLPVFLPRETLEMASPQLRRLTIEGEPVVEYSGPVKLGKAEADVFHALVHLGTLQHFDGRKVRFVARDLLEVMKWGYDGRAYKRLSDALENLTEVSLKIYVKGRDEAGQQRRLQQKVRFFQDYAVWSDAEESEGGAAFESTVEVADSLIRLCEGKRLKQMHRYYFSLGSFVAKRMFELLTASASDLPMWRIELFKLRDLIPLQGVKYEHRSGVKQVVKRAIDRFMKDNIIRSAEFQKVAGTKRIDLVVVPNHDYFYSERYRRSRRTAAKPLHPVAQQLVSRGVEQSVARGLVSSKGPEAAAQQLEHLAFLKASGRSESIVTDAGWLTAAIRKGYALPEGFVSQSDRERQAQAQRIETAASEALREGKHERAAELAEQAISLTDLPSAKSLLSDVKKAQRLQTEEQQLQRWLESRDELQLAELHTLTRTRLRELGGMTEELGFHEPEHPLYEAHFSALAMEAMRTEKTQLSLLV